ncbi:MULTISPECIES: hypothetical protein [Morganella]|uniref:hypothetical protein n=1 Tax=Morganella TaxID=581 RepID=UPI0021CE775A|nr:MULTISPECIES: hypothetical protein [Morganella]MCU6378565.1 hypothetical protein [Morganella morganii]MDH0353587.1 hypothetical protein [Morganella sp. GD04133]
MKLSENTLKKIDNIETENYIAKVKSEFFYKYGGDIKKPESMTERLTEAYAYVISVGFTNEKLIRSFLLYEACVPGYHKVPSIRNMLEEQDCNPEQQYKDYLHILTKKLEWR